MPYIEQGKMQDFLAGVMETPEYYDAFNADRIEEITLTERNQKFADSVRVFLEVEVTNESAYMALLLISTQNQE